MKRNCWTCAHDFTFGAAQTRHCALIPTATDALSKATIEWADGQVLDRALMPPPDADGCPGYESSAPMMGAPEHYTAMHIPPPVEPQDRAQPPAHVVTEANAFEPASAPWDADDEGREIG